MIQKLDIKNLLEVAIEEQATDIHLVTGKSPIFRIHGELITSNLPMLEEDDLKGLLFSMLNEKQKASFQANQDLDFSYSSLKDFYLRVNVHIDKGSLAATIRIMPIKIQNAQTLGLPSILDEIARKRKGLVLIVGPAGSGKTTTLTYMVDLINTERRCKIITIEDPIEYIHQSKQSLIIQREVGVHTQSFATALKYALRQDPDVVIIGEMRDLESISMALTTAETGHLVLTTLHAPDTIEAINRIIDVYPTDKQNQVRVQIGENLLAIIGQTLLPRNDAAGRVLSTEVMIANIAIRNLIRRGALFEIRGQMEAGKESGMITQEQCLSNLVKQGFITKETAKEHAKYPNFLQC